MLDPWIRNPNADLDPEVMKGIKWRDNQSLINNFFIFHRKLFFLAIFAKFQTRKYIFFTLKGYFEINSVILLAWIQIRIYLISWIRIISIRIHVTGVIYWSYVLIVRWKRAVYFINSTESKKFNTMAHFSVKYSDTHHPLKLEPENNNLFEFLCIIHQCISFGNGGENVIITDSSGRYSRGSTFLRP